MPTQCTDATPPDPSGGGDSKAAGAERPERRRAAAWSPYQRRICFHPRAGRKDEQPGEDDEASGSPKEADELAELAP